MVNTLVCFATSVSVEKGALKDRKEGFNLKLITLLAKVVPT